MYQHVMDAVLFLDFPALECNSTHRVDHTHDVTPLREKVLKMSWKQSLKT